MRTCCNCDEPTEKRPLVLREEVKYRDALLKKSKLQKFAAEYKDWKMSINTRIPYDLCNPSQLWWLRVGPLYIQRISAGRIIGIAHSTNLGSFFFFVSGWSPFSKSREQMETLSASGSDGCWPFEPSRRLRLRWKVTCLSLVIQSIMSENYWFMILEKLSRTSPVGNHSSNNITHLPALFFRKGKW